MRLWQACAAVVFGGSLLFTFAPASQAQFLFTFDENGDGTMVQGNSTTTITGTLVNDPSNLGHNALEYTLPFVVTEGDVGISDFGGNTVSDGLRFTDSNGGLTGIGDLMLFYSTDLGGGALADTGLPGNWTGTIDASEGPNGNFTYAPASNEIYMGLSPDSPSTPEPGAFGLACGSCLAGVGILRRHRRK